MRMKISDLDQDLDEDEDENCSNPSVPWGGAPEMCRCEDAEMQVSRCWDAAAGSVVDTARNY